MQSCGILFLNPPGWEMHKKAIYCFSILTLSRCTDHKQNFTVYFCNVVHVSTFVHVRLSLVVLRVRL